MLFGDATERHLSCLVDSPSPERFRERVTNVREHTTVSREMAVETFEDALSEWAAATEGEWSESELARARERADEKYRSEAWNRNREDTVA